MTRYNLSPYKIEIRKKNSRKLENIDNLLGSDKKLSDIIKQAITDWTKKPFIDKDSKKALKFQGNIPEKDEGNNKYIQDVIYYGEYGVLRKIMDINTGNIDKNKIEPNESPVYDLVFTYFEDPLIKNRAYLITQTYSLHGYKTIFEKLLTEKLKKIFASDVSVSIVALFSKELGDKILKKGRIIDITFLSEGISRDSADNLDEYKNGGLDVDNIERFEFSLISSRKHSLAIRDQINDLIKFMNETLRNSKKTLFYNMVKTDLAEIKVKIATKEKDMIVSLGGDDLSFRENYPLDEKIVEKDDGSINHEYVLEESISYSKTVSDKYRGI